MSELITVTGATLALKTGTGTVFANNILSVIANKVKCSAHSVYTTLAFTVSGYFGGPVSNGTGAGLIVGSATKVKAEGAAVVLENDSVLVTISDGSHTTTDTVYVSVAGQLKVKAV
jgi:hypothetical protein